MSPADATPRPAPSEEEGDNITINEAWLRATMGKFLIVAWITGGAIGALVMFLICHFRWELL